MKLDTDLAPSYCRQLMWMLQVGECHDEIESVHYLPAGCPEKQNQEITDFCLLLLQPNSRDIGDTKNCVFIFASK